MADFLILYPPDVCFATDGNGTLAFVQFAIKAYLLYLQDVLFVAKPLLLLQPVGAVKQLPQPLTLSEHYGLITIRLIRGSAN